MLPVIPFMNRAQTSAGSPCGFVAFLDDFGGAKGQRSPGLNGGVFSRLDDGVVPGLDRPVLAGFGADVFRGERDKLFFLVDAHLHPRLKLDDKLVQ
ncbi:hypothetical protein, partial [uncultured Desulfovibrio sp.]|uniref:hypothetical protein n=1 Tax=uncultured Desulfovibrio sp. TaxID=167968 RepID=UPI00263AB8D9